MANPKLQTIMQAMSARLAAINLGNGYRTDIGKNIIRGNYSLDDSMWPGSVIRLEGRAIDSEVNQRGIISATVFINAYKAIGDDEPEDVAIWMLADIQKAIELVNDRDLAGLLMANLAWQGDSIIYPENKDSGVSVQVEYSLPHVRFYGDAEK